MFSTKCTSETQRHYHLTHSEDTLINMLSHLSDCFPLASLTIEVQTVGQRRHRQWPSGTQSLNSDIQCGLPGRHQCRGQLVCFTASVLRCWQATFVSGTAVTLQHNGLLIKGRGNRRLFFHHKSRQEWGFGYPTSVSNNSADNKRQSGCLRKCGTRL